VYEVNLLGGQAKAKLLHDISNTHDGFTGRVEYERSLLTGSTYMVTGLADRNTGAVRRPTTTSA
ncbi:MAG: hypothetical protein JAY64_22730, partial [Candidatus Thiodiazotropha weberae]|nr:hypothetical protein [Candidatus Thiodiazotropha lotti]MCW4213975.1 hypothetical protein [Candidatus Thiodiazotropha lotti]